MQTSMQADPLEAEPPSRGRPPWMQTSRVTWPVMHAGKSNPPVDRMTDGCESITLKNISLEGRRFKGMCKSLICHVLIRYLLRDCPGDLPHLSDWFLRGSRCVNDPQARQKREHHNVSNTNPNSWDALLEIKSWSLIIQSWSCCQ